MKSGIHGIKVLQIIRVIYCFYRGGVQLSDKLVKKLDFLIDEGWSDHYKLTEITFGENRWVLLFAKGTRYSNQRYDVATSWSDASELIEEQLSKDKDIIELEYALGKWVMVFSIHTGYTAQRYMSRDTYDDFEKEAMALRQKGYFIIDLATGW